MSFSVKCPKCASVHRVSDDLAGTLAQCKCGAKIRIPQRKSPAAPAPTLSVACPGCGRTHNVDASMAGRAARCDCGTTLRIPTAAGPQAAAAGLQPLATEPAPLSSLFDEIPPDPLAPQPMPTASTASKTLPKSDYEVLSQYTDVNAARKPKKEYSGAFAPEQKGLGYGVVGGLVMMLIAVVWFFGGLFCGVIFYYPPILFIIGLFGLLKGLFTGNIAGR